MPPTREEFEARLRSALTGASDVEYRSNLGLWCWDFMSRVWQRRMNAASARSQWNWFRYAGAVIPVLAAGAGGTLLGHLHGTSAAAIGWVALIGGLTGAAINSVRPAVEYGVDLTKTSQFERLYWDVFNYAMGKLPVDAADDIAAALKCFAQRMDEIATVSGSSAATSS